MKKLRIGRRRGRGDDLALSPLELALYPALSDARWQIPDRFNFARDVVEAMSDDPKRRAVTFIGKDGIIEPRTFHQIAERAARWSWLLRERGVRPGDPVLVLAGTNVDWLEVVLGCMKVGAVVVPGSPNVTAETLDVRVERTGAELIVAEPSVEPEVARMVERPLVLYLDEGSGLLDTVAEQAPTHDSSARDIAFVLSTAGTGGVPKLVGHSHGSVFASRVAAEHWLDAGRGDAIWAPADPSSATSILYALVGPWSRGAETLLHDGPFDPLERLDLIYRLGVTVLCQSPAEYAALAELREVTRFQPPQLRRLVSTGDVLDPEVSRVFEEAWGLTIHDGYGQAETGVVLANSGEAGFRPGSLGYPLPGHLIAVIDDQGNELSPGVEGELAVRGRPPTLFAGYWESPEETKQAFRGDWYATGDLATVDEEGFFWFVGRSADMITSRGARFGPYETERALRALAPVAAAAVVGVRDLERGGQFLRAFVVPAAGAKTSEQLEAELRHEVAESLPDHAVPREIEFVDELPTVTGGKLRRVELRERLVVGRPLWDMPPTTEADDGPDLWAGMLAPWPAEAETPAAAPAVDASTGEPLPDYIVPPAHEPEPEPAPVPEPEPVLEAVPDPVPEPTPPAPVAEVLAEPIAVPEIAPEPVLEPLPDYVFEPRTTEPASEPEASAAEAAPTLEPEAVAPEPVPEARQPVADPTVEQVVEPVVDDAPVSAVEEPAAPLRPMPDRVVPVRPPEWSVPLPSWGADPTDENVAEAERLPEHVAEFEPPAESTVESTVESLHAQPAVPEPEAPAEPEATPPTLEAVPAMPEPEQGPEPAFEPDLEPPAALEAIPALEQEIVFEPEPEPEPKATVWTPRPSLEPTRELEPERPDSVWTPFPHGPQPEHAEPEHLVEPEPTPGPTTGPEQPASADDLIVDPQETHAPQPVAESQVPPPAGLLDEEPVDHGPLPDYIVDPENPEDEPSRPIVRADSAAEALASTTLPDVPAERVDPEPRLENLGLPPLSEFPGITRDPAERPAPRLDRPPEAQSRTTPQPKRRGRRATAAEPGDEVDANAWMDGLSSRLSAYSLTGEEEAANGEPDDESAADAPDEQPSD